MLFQKIYNIAQETALTMSFTANREAGTLTVVVIPKMVDEKANPALRQPLSFEATPEELEAEFAEALGSYAASRKSLADALKDTETVIEAAKKEATSKATKAIKTASPKAAAANKPDKAEEKAPTGSTVPVTVPAEAPADAENLFE